MLSSFGQWTHASPAMPKRSLTIERLSFQHFLYKMTDSLLRTLLIHSHFTRLRVYKTSSRLQNASLSDSSGGLRRHRQLHQHSASRQLQRLFRMPLGNRQTSHRFLRHASQTQSSLRARPTYRVSCSIHPLHYTILLSFISAQIRSDRRREVMLTHVCDSIGAAPSDKAPTPSFSAGLSHRATVSSPSANR